MTITVEPLELSSFSVTGAWCARPDALYGFVPPEPTVYVYRVADARITVAWKEQQRYPWRRQPITRHILEPGGDFALILKTRGLDVTVTLDRAVTLDRLLGEVVVVHQDDVDVGSDDGWTLHLTGPEQFSLPEFSVPRGGIHW